MDAAQRLKDEIEAKAVKLPEHPKLYRAGRVTGTRKIVVRSDFVVAYTENACGHCHDNGVRTLRP